jgi:hypothetical protein
MVAAIVGSERTGLTGWDQIDGEGRDSAAHKAQKQQITQPHGDILAEGDYKVVYHWKTPGVS